MTDSRPSKLDEIKARFEAELPARIRDIRAAFDRFVWPHLDDRQLNDMLGLVHRLAGSAGTFDHPDLGEVASALCRRLEILRTSADHDPVAWDAITRGMAELAHTGYSRQPPASEGQVDSSRERQLHPRIAIVDDDLILAKALGEIVESAGYRVDVFQKPESFIGHCHEQGTPDVVLMDLDFPSDGPLAGAEALAALRTCFDPPPLAVLISRHNDLPSRLAAYRGGACRYLLKPVAGDQLIHVLDQLTSRAEERAYRVMVVDDDERLAELYGLILRNAGFEVETLSQPLRLLERLGAFQPDVLLLDVYMPEASGPELAAVLREDASLSWLPILFLSAESDPGKHALALAHGGDDFLIKPVRPAYMLAAVKARAWRARRNRSDLEALRRRVQPAGS